MALKVGPTAARSAPESAGAAMAASVARKQNMVARLGWIMPEPLAQAAMRTCLPAMRIFSAAHLGTVSVVMIERANCSKEPASGLRERTSSGTERRILSTCSGAPITPVEHTGICDDGADFPARFLQVRAGQQHRGRRHLIGRK